MNSTYIFIATGIFITIFFLSSLLYFTFSQYMKYKLSGSKSNHLYKDDFRTHYDKEIREIYERFSASEKRWRELNHLLLSGQRNASEATVPPMALSQSIFLKEHGIDAPTTPVRSNLIFVLTPFDDAYDADFQIIARLGREIGFDVSRGDEKALGGEMFSNILKLIAQARLVIANISDRNPNVYYELGIAHAFDKPCILITRSLSSIPFDLHSKQIVIYDSPEDLKLKLQIMLLRVLPKRDSEVGDFSSN